ncbi:hypothetical protein TIFTF001_011635 [Ficus carica]|uniref:Uncharacterized protein n=1 Tax=Ficus carica TaxID=3494 RepID=A0AA87ZXJ5_FICCA|nr:hypothetical protein TIFTF001_011635 [Ficus carica]
MVATTTTAAAAHAELLHRITKIEDESCTTTRHILQIVGINSPTRIFSSWPLFEIVQGYVLFIGCLYG